MLNPTQSINLTYLFTYITNDHLLHAHLPDWAKGPLKV